MIATGNLLKMPAQIVDGQIQYSLTLGQQHVDMNQLVGKHIKLNYLNVINCIKCGAETKKSFNQGFCFPCFQKAPEADECILNPEKCKAHYGISRDMEWAKTHCLTTHYVYLAVSSGLKVGVTRQSQIPTRWIDQGAWKGIILAEVPNRHTAGVIEVFLKTFLSDKTNWRTMLKNELATHIDLIEEKKKALALIPAELQQYASPNNLIIELNYPVETYPTKPQTLSFDTQTTVEGKVMGFKGQYLLLDNDRVFNFRKHNGYLTELCVE